MFFPRATDFIGDALLAEASFPRSRTSTNILLEEVDATVMLLDRAINLMTDRSQLLIFTSLLSLSQRWKFKKILTLELGRM